MLLEQQAARKIMDDIYEKTDMMFNAIKVNEFDIFESNLQLRETLLQDFSEIKKKLNTDDLQVLEVDSFLRKMLMVNKKIDHELRRFHKELENDLKKTRIEKSKLSQNQKKTNQYQSKTSATVSGNYFDKSK